MSEISRKYSIEDIDRSVEFTTVTQTFINFEELKYFSVWPRVMDRHLINTCKYEPIDCSIADPIMRLNSIEGVKTRYCCSGHLTHYEGYIWFASITPEVLQTMRSLKFWYEDMDYKHSEESPTFRVKEDGSNLSRWFDALKELYEAFKDRPNHFEQQVLLSNDGSCRIVSEDLYKRYDDFIDRMNQLDRMPDVMALSEEDKKTVEEWNNAVGFIFDEHLA